MGWDGDVDYGAVNCGRMVGGKEEGCGVGDGGGGPRAEVDAGVFGEAGGVSGGVSGGGVVRGGEKGRSTSLRLWRGRCLLCRLLWVRCCE